MPHAVTEDNVGVVDTTTSTFSTISITETVDVKYLSSSAVGNKVFFAPSQADNVGVLDTTTSTFTTISIDTTGTYKYFGAAAVGTSVFLAPFNADTVGVVESYFA